MIKNKQAGMEMSVGTIVTIVLLMTVLILGLVLVRGIFSSSKNAIDQIDDQIQGQINKLFTEGEGGKKVVIFPTNREITMDKGDEGGFGFSIQNLEKKEAGFTYSVYATEIAKDCTMSKADADDLIVLGKDGSSPIRIQSGSVLEDAILVKFSIPDTASLCKIRYIVDVKKDGQAYSSPSVDLTIK